MVEDAVCKGKVAGSIPDCGEGLLPVRHCDSDSGSDEILQLFFFCQFFGSVNLHFLAR